MISRQEELISTLRQAIKLQKTSKLCLDYCETIMRQLLADATSMIGTKRTIKKSGIEFMYTGVLKNRFDKRKRF